MFRGSGLPYFLILPYNCGAYPAIKRLRGVTIFRVMVEKTFPQRTSSLNVMVRPIHRRGDIQPTRVLVTYGYLNRKCFRPTIQIMICTIMTVLPTNDVSRTRCQENETSGALLDRVRCLYVDRTQFIGRVRGRNVIYITRLTRHIVSCHHGTYNRINEISIVISTI